MDAQTHLNIKNIALGDQCKQMVHFLDQLHQIGYRIDVLRKHSTSKLSNFGGKRENGILEAWNWFWLVK